MGDVLLIILAIILLLGGILGSFLPVLPGPPLSFAGLMVMHFTSQAGFSLRFILIALLLTIVVTVADLVLPSYATRRTGGSRRGMVGAAIGLAAGLFLFPPVGIILGPFLGAFLAELTHNNNANRAFKAALGSFLGLIWGTVLKLAFSLVITWYTLKPLFYSVS
ncbi:MAG: DUF456 domain-containing protein [Bacteroidales bacterium]